MSLFHDSLAADSLLSVGDAAVWATKRSGRNITPSNILYLIQYGRVSRVELHGSVFVPLPELESYYSSFDAQRETRFKQQLGDDLNWELSFSQVKEAETTKHVHRLHPYKGKFIPQLVEYFIGAHTDSFKQKSFFLPGDIVLDPFCGSGTTLVQANECGLDGIGIDVSAFNALITNSKLAQYELQELHQVVVSINTALHEHLVGNRVFEFETALLEELNTFNDRHFPSPEYMQRLRRGEINEREYGSITAEQFLPTFNTLAATHGVAIDYSYGSSFLEKWYHPLIRDEISFLYTLISKVANPLTRTLLSVVLSRTMRSCRATTHSDLATLVDPVFYPYYCHKHGKICKPLFTMSKWWQRYCKDTITRLSAFNELRTDTWQHCIAGDSREVDIIEKLRPHNPLLAAKVQQQGIQGIFTSPPYVGLIDYHEQHAYAYELLGIPRHDASEIGPLYRGKGKAAQESYVEGIVKVLLHCRRYLAPGYHVLIVANDKHQLYPRIAAEAGMVIVNEFLRPVLNRSERDKNPYAETIFHLQEA